MGVRVSKKMVAAMRRQMEGKEPEVVSDEPKVVGQSEEYDRYSRQVKNYYNAPVKLESFIRDTFIEVVGEAAARDVPLVLIHKRNAYELLTKYFTLSREKLPAVLKTQLTKARAMTHKAWTAEENFMMGLWTRHKLGDTTMAVATKTGKPVKEKKPSVHKSAKGENVAQWYMRTYEENFKKKLSDKEIASEFKKEFPQAKHQPDEKYIAYVRNVFNRGKLVPQKKVAPKTPLPEFIGGKAQGFMGRDSEEKNNALTKAGIKFEPVKAEPPQRKNLPKKVNVNKKRVVVKK